MSFLETFFTKCMGSNIYFYDSLYAHIHYTQNFGKMPERSALLWSNATRC